jgi:hypothetical protein
MFSDAGLLGQLKKALAERMLLRTIAKISPFQQRLIRLLRCLLLHSYTKPKDRLKWQAHGLFRV